MAGLLGYFLIMIRQSWLLTSNNDISSGGKQMAPFHGGGMRATRHAIELKRVEDAQTALEEEQRRSTLRMQHTRPPPSTVKISSYTIVPMEERPLSRQQQQQQEQDDNRPATLDDLCGIHAKNASKEHSNNYLQKDALGPKSRVMITGILNPIGFHLALALQEKCGVQVMTGIDYMFPNTVSHRLALQKRIQLLTSNIPKLVQPIVLPLVGLDPRRNKNLKNEPSLIPATRELSLLNFRPTHIVHLASYSPDEYMDPQKFWNYASPYVTETRNAELYKIRSSLVSMEQILASIATASNDDETAETPRPHLVYASSVKGHHDAVHASLKTADELLADTYHSLEQVYSVGVRLPNAVYGPWGRPGSTMYQLSDAAVANWNSAATDSRKLLESADLGDVSDRVGDFLYVSDAVDAIIAAMQFRTTSQSPILFEVQPESRMPLSSTASAALGLMQPQSESSIETVEIKESPLMQQTESFLKWKASTSFHEGMMKMLAWHLDNEPPTAQHDDSNALSNTCAGDVFLKQQGAEPCAADDILCLSGRKVLPCVSECATNVNCVSSVFDEVVELTKEVTEQCDYILYTQSLGYNVKDLKLQAKYDDAGEQIVCNSLSSTRECSSGFRH
jgi:nucleoside-diphosphate-sugar epimerase